jgi:glycosyltransferase involved in cell wall biosynthesis
MFRIIFVIPAYNESNLIKDFITELNNSFRDVTPKFIVINDASTDNTAEAIQEIKKEISVHLITNTHNLGHGQSLLKGLNLAVTQEPEVIISVDGDGHFRSIDIRHAFDAFINSFEKIDILEGVRQYRVEPSYRKYVSMITKLLVWIRCKKFPSDANTPLRIFKTESISKILLAVPKNTVIPNLHISSLSRIFNMKITEFPISWVNRKGVLKSGTSWGPERTFFPPKRFVVFCLDAFTEWVKPKR